MLTLLGTVSADIIGIQSGFNAASSVASFITALTGGTVGPVEEYYDIPLFTTSEC